MIDAHRKIEASSKEKEEEYFKAVPVTITTEGDKVIVRAIHKNESFGAQFWHLLGRTRTEARYTFKVPATFSVNLDTAGGDISANGLTGTIKVDTSGGDLNFGQIHGDIHADTSGGDITAKDCDGATNLDTSGGRIEVTGGRGKLNVDTSGGNVTVLNRVGDAKVESSGGKLRLGNISGSLNAETSGGSVSAILPSPVAGDVRLETSGGSITVVAPSNAALTIDAETSAGSVRSDLPISRIHADDDSLKGTINGGGPSSFCGAALARSKSSQPKKRPHSNRIGLARKRQCSPISASPSANCANRPGSLRSPSSPWRSALGSTLRFSV